MYVPLMRAVAAVTFFLAWSFTCYGLGQNEPADNDLQSTVEAPPGTRELAGDLGGAYFVDAELLDRYEAIKSRLAQLRDEIARGKTSGDAALKTLADIEQEMRSMRDALDMNKKFISAFQVYSQTTEETFPLGDEQLIIVTGDNVIVRGWQGPGIKCELKKVILAKQQPAESEFDEIHVTHQLEVAQDKVGLTRQQREQEEQEYLASEDGRKLSDEQKKNRRAFVEEIHSSYDIYEGFQGRKANTIQLTGLSYEEGNRQVSMQITSPGGGGISSSQWQRHATMTVFVPACRLLAVRGCQVGLDIQDISCDLILTTHDSRDRNYEGLFQVQGVKGNVHIAQVPVRLLSNVSGNVQFNATNEFVNQGTLHTNGTRTFSTYDTHTTRIEGIEGDVQATFLRTELQLSDIAGRLDIVNQYGSTHLRRDVTEAPAAHRIITDSGQIQVEGSQEALTKAPLYAFTECGQLHTNLPQDILEDLSFSTGRPQRGWHGFVTPSQERFDPARFERPGAALENRERAAGLDLISHAGMVTILRADAAP